MPQASIHLHRRPVIRLNFRRCTSSTTHPAQNTGSRLRKGNHIGTRSWHIIEAAESLVMELIGYCEAPEGFEDHVADEALSSQMVTAAIQVRNV